MNKDNILISPELKVNSLSSAASKSYNALTFLASLTGAAVAVLDVVADTLLTDGYKDVLTVFVFLGDPR